MATHDYVIANGTGAAVRSDLNDALAAIVSNNSSSSEPATTYAYQWWADTNANVLKIRNSANNAWITLRELDGTMLIEDGSASTPGLAFADDTNTGIFSGGADEINIATGGTQRFAIDSSGRLLVGTSSARSNFSAVDTPQLQIEGTTFDAATISVTSASSTSGGNIELAGTGAGTIGSTGTVSNNGYLGSIHFLGGDGSNLRKGAAIDCQVDGTPGTNDMPGRLVLSTTADGASSPTERMRLTSDGKLGIGATAPDAILEVGGVATSGETEAFAIERSDGVDLYRINYDPSTNSMEFQANNKEFAFQNLSSFGESARIDDSGRLLVGLSSARANFFNSASGQETQFQIEGNSYLKGGASFTSNATATDQGPHIVLAHERSGSVGGNTIVISGSNLGTIAFQGSDGSEMVDAARIVAEVDGTPGSNDMPGRLVFLTTADGASGATERVKIQQDGLFRAFSENSVIHSYSASAAGTTKNLYWGGHSATNVDGAGSTNTFAVKTNGNVLNTNNSYGALSDVKLKENIVDASSQWDDIKGIRVRNYNFIEGQTHTQLGVVAQEVETVSPGLVYDTPDTDDDGNDLGTVTKSVNYSVLYMKAVKALQEAMDRIETLETKVAALEAG